MASLYEIDKLLIVTLDHTIHLKGHLYISLATTHNMVLQIWLTKVVSTIIGTLFQLIKLLESMQGHRDHQMHLCCHHHIFLMCQVLAVVIPSILIISHLTASQPLAESLLHRVDGPRGRMIAIDISDISFKGCVLLLSSIIQSYMPDAFNVEVY